MRNRIASGELAIISAGFRCFTKAQIIKQLGIEQESLAFDSGFFPPSAVAKMLESDRIDLQQGHTACLKFENFEHDQHGKGLRFTFSTYEEIDRLAVSPTMAGLNRLLDSTFGYYTLNIAHHYVLAHYNWHRFAAGKEGRNRDISGNIRSTGELLTKRLNRLKQKGRDAKRVLLVVGETQGYRYMMIDDALFPLDEHGEIADAARRLFGSKCQIVTLDDIATPECALALL
ncbi:hypothetical protein DM806_16215 [Sphingobium lactosutens]|nr:hypothetical protein [Sphingobium lactosutens]